jgi:hypothetical protein
MKINMSQKYKMEPEFLDEGESTQRYLGKHFFLLL